MEEQGVGFEILSFLFPFVGLILYLVWMERYPIKAKACARGALFGTGIGLLLVMMFFR